MEELLNKELTYGQLARGVLKEKHENKYIRVSKEDYEKVIEILKREGIEIN